MKKIVSLLLAAILACAVLSTAAGEELLTFGNLSWETDQAQFQAWAAGHGMALYDWHDLYDAVYPELFTVLGLRLEELEFEFDEAGLQEIRGNGKYRMMRQTPASETMLLDDGALSRALAEMLSRYGQPAKVYVWADRMYAVPPEELPSLIPDLLRFGEYMKSHMDMELYYSNFLFRLSCDIPMTGTDMYEAFAEAEFRFAYVNHSALEVWDEYHSEEQRAQFPLLNGKWQLRELAGDE